jgi:hypothetical protein
MHCVRATCLMTKHVQLLSRFAEFKDAIAEIKSTLRLPTWMLSLNTGGIALILGKLFL